MINTFLLVINSALLIYLIMKIRWNERDFTVAAHPKMDPTDRSPASVITIGNKEIHVDDIILLQSKHGGVTIINTSSETFVWASLNGLHLLLPESFIRCHRSYLVHRKYILGRTERHVLLNTQEKIPIGKAYLNNLTSIPKIDEL